MSVQLVKYQFPKVLATESVSSTKASYAVSSLVRKGMPDGGCWHNLPGEKTTFWEDKFICWFCCKTNRVSFLIKLQAYACNFIKKETLARVFSFEFCGISKNTFFTEHLWEYCHSWYGIMEELVKLEPLKGTTTWRDVFIGFLRATVEMNLDLRKLISVSTNGPPSVVGRINGFISLLKWYLSDDGINHSLIKFHRIAHQKTRSFWHLISDESCC